MTNWEKGEKHTQRGKKTKPNQNKSKQAFLPSIQKQHSSKGHGGWGGGRRIKQGENGLQCCRIFSCDCFCLLMKLPRRIHLFSLYHQTEGLEACTLTFPSHSPSSQMYWEGTQIPCPPNIIIPIQAGAAWKSTFTAH